MGKTGHLWGWMGSFGTGLRAMERGEGEGGGQAAVISTLACVLVSLYCPSHAGAARCHSHGRVDVTGIIRYYSTPCIVKIHYRK